MNKPNFLGVGEHKCGTIWLSECLRYHPEIFMSSPKEVFFFGKRYRERGLEWYLSFFEDANGYKAVGEFSTSYLRKKCAPKQILESLGKVRIIVCIRNPTKRFISEYKHLIRNGYLSKEEFKSLDRDTYHKVIAMGLHILEKGNYSYNIQRYFDAFGTDNVLVVDNKSMHDKPLETLKDTYSFLNVDPTYSPPIMEQRIRGIIPRNEWLNRARRAVWLWLRDHYPHGINLLKRLYIPELYSMINTGELIVSDEVILELNRHYAEEVASLADILNRDLAWTGF